MSASVWIALRYLVTRRRQFAAFVTWISVAGLTLGVLVLTVVVSVMNGFDAELRQRMLGSVPHLIIEGESITDPDVAALLDRPAPDRLGQRVDEPVHMGRSRRALMIGPAPLPEVPADRGRELELHAPLRGPVHRIVLVEPPELARNLVEVLDDAVARGQPRAQMRGEMARETAIPAA